MNIPSPILDDSSYDDLRDRLVKRIPFYNPEWTDHNPSDPGITLLELFAYLGEHMLFRFNQIPEKTYLEYLNLLQIQRRAAGSASVMVTFSTEELDGVFVADGAEVAAGPTRFQTESAAHVWPLGSVALSRAMAPLPAPDSEDYAFVELAMDALGEQGSGLDPAGYENRIIDPAAGTPVDLDESVDGILWIAVLNSSKQSNQQVLDRLREGAGGGKPPVILNVGMVPDQAPPAVQDIAPCPGRNAAANGRPVQWQVSSQQLIDDESPLYRPLKVVADTTYGLTEEGVVRLEVTSDDLGNFELLDEDRAGTGDLPPVLDDESEAKLLFWIRAFRPRQGDPDPSLGRILEVSLNATRAVQSVSARPEFLGTGNGQPNQTFRLNHLPVVTDSQLIEVEGPGGWEAWSEVDGFHASLGGDHHYTLDRQAGTVTFGRVTVPQTGQRIRVRGYRYGGGRAGNVAAESITRLASKGGGDGFSAVKVINHLPARGGSDDESIEAALARIPGEIRRRDRAVTPGDFQEQALLTPGADIGRAETLELYRPATGETEAAGVVTTVVWPLADPAHPNAPKPRADQLHRVCRWLDQRRLVTTEVYVIPPEYWRVAISVGVEVKPGFAIDAVRSWVELVLRQYLAPMPPFGPEGSGWPLDRNLAAPELEAVVSQVEGVRSLYVDQANRGLRIKIEDPQSGAWSEPAVIGFHHQFVPEVAGVTVVEGPPLDPEEALAPVVSRAPVPIPVEREEC